MGTPDPTSTDGGAAASKVAPLATRIFASLVRVSDARKRTVLADIEVGSVPTSLYYVLLGISELIAGFGLIIDSPTTIIGANIVAPLMTPIFGVALGLVRGDLRLLRNGLTAEFGGAALGVALTFVLGLLPMADKETASLLSQTNPTLIDLFVAALAGLAGCLAMIDERISPALPGVAIATALNPPIAAIGICLALGAYHGAWGAFLLFFANVLAILAVGAVTFLAAGFVKRSEFGSLREVGRRFVAAAVGLVVVTGLLTGHLYSMVRELRLTRTVTAILDAELADDPNSTLEQVTVEQGRDEGLSVLAVLRAPRVISPPKVKAIEEAIVSRLGEPLRLYMRVTLTKDVTASGSTSLLPHRSLDGAFTRAQLSPDGELLQKAEQVIREVLAERPAINLTDVTLLRLATGPVVVASIEMARDPQPVAIGRAEEILRARVGDPSVRLVTRSVSLTDMTSKGQILYGQAHFGNLPEDEVRTQYAVEEAVKVRLNALPSVFVTAVDAVPAAGGWDVRAAVVGAHVPTPAEVKAAEETVAKQTGQPLKLSVWARTEVLVSASRTSPVDAPAAGRTP